MEPNVTLPGKTSLKSQSNSERTILTNNFTMISILPKQAFMYKKMDLHSFLTFAQESNELEMNSFQNTEQIFSHLSFQSYQCCHSTGP